MSFPVVTPFGITKVTPVAELTVQLVTVTPLNDIESTPAKFEPLTDMTLPTVAAVGLIELTEGDEADVP